MNFFTAAIAGGLLALGVLSGSDSLWLTAGPAGAAMLVIVTVPALPRLLARLRPQERSGRAGRVLVAVQSALSGGIADARLLVHTGNPQILAGAVGFMLLDVAALGAAFWAIGGLPPAGILLPAAVLAYRAFQLGLPALLGAPAIVRLPAVLQRAPDVGGLCSPLPAPARAPVRSGRGAAIAA